MNFRVSQLLAFITWVGFTCAMLVSKALWVNDLYLLAGYAIWVFAVVRAFATKGRMRLFWSTVAASCFMFSRPIIVAFTSGWIRSVLGVEGGGTEYGEFGHDVLFSSPPDQRIQSTMFWTFQKINAPLVIGGICGALRIVANRWAFPLAVAPLFLSWLFCAYAMPNESVRTLQVLFSFCVVISLTIPLTSSSKYQKFWLGYACGIGVFAFATAENSRFVFRNVAQALHALHDWIPSAANSAVVNLQSSMAIYILGVCFALVSGLVCHVCCGIQRTEKDVGT